MHRTTDECDVARKEFPMLLRCTLVALGICLTTVVGCGGDPDPQDNLNWYSVVVQ